MNSKQSEAEILIQKFLESKNSFLDLGNCGLTDESYEFELLAACTQLKSLSLGTGYYNTSGAEVSTDNTGKQNNFNTIPRNLPSGLTELQIRNAGILVIGNLESFSQLTLLDLSLNRLERIENLNALLKLRELALHGNFIKRIENLENLKSLEVLHLTRNKIELIENVNHLDQLVNLYLSVNEIKKIENLNGLDNLYSLDLNKNRIEKIENLEALTNVQVLNLSENKIKKIENLDKLVQLSTLHLAGNEITRIENLDKLINLGYVTLDKNKIPKIENMENLVKIDFLGLDDNLIGKIENLENLVNLKNLYLTRNKIKKIENLETLKKLEVFYFQENEIQKIEPVLKIKTLKSLFCYGNPINDCPADVWQTNDITQIRAYFEKTAVKADSAPEAAITKDVKLILIGNSNSGKTNLVNYLVNGHFLSERNSTHGLNVIRWEPDKERFPLLKDIHISIWDFGGQEYYHDAYKLFLSANAVYAVLWEKDTDKNFRKITKVTDDKDEDLEHFEKKYWLDTVRFYGDNKDTAPLLLVQNKTDNQAADKLRISQEMFNEYSLQECYHISLKEGCNTANIQQERILQNFEKELESILLAAADKAETKEQWQIVRKEILSVQENNFDDANAFSNYVKEDTWIDIEDFNTVCMQLTAGQLSENDLYTLPRWLDKCGVVVFFEKNDQLNDKVFISPKKLSEKIYQVLNRDVLSKKGEFNKNEINGTESFKETFIEAALGLELVFRHPVIPDYFIAPQYLPAQHAIEDLFKIASANAWQDSYWIKVPLFYYKKLLNRLILNYVGDSSVDARYFWKHGIVFVKNELRVLIKGLYPNENQSEGIILIGVEDKEDRSIKKTLQKEIFQFIFNYGAEGRQPTEQEQLKQTGTAKVVEREVSRISNNNSKFLENIKLSYDNESYESFNRLKLLAETNEQFFLNEKSLVKLSLYRFLPVLPFQISIKPPKKVFVSYSHLNTNWLNRLRIHLSGLKHSGMIDDWTDQEILAGEKWDKKIKDNMEQADVFICLLSADFVASDYIWNTELKTVFEKIKKKNAKVIFIYVEPFDLGSIKGSKISDDLSDTTILDFEIIPKDINGHLKAAGLWENENLALTTIVKRIREAIEDKQIVTT